MKNINRRYYKAIQFILIIAFACGCKSFLKSDVKSSSENLVVYKVGENANLYSTSERKRWISLSRKASIDLEVVYANLALGDLEAAETMARSQMTEKPDHLDAMTALSRVLISQKRPKLAKYYANYILEKDQTRFEVYNILGLAKIAEADKMSDLKKAKLYFKKGFYSENPSIASGLNLGYLELETGSVADAKKVFKETSSYCGDCLEAMLGLGIAERRLGDESSSIELLRKAIKSKSLELIAGYHLVLAYKDNGDLTKADKLMVALLAKIPKSMEPLRTKSELLASKIQTEIELEDK